MCADNRYGGTESPTYLELTAGSTWNGNSGSIQGNANKRARSNQIVYTPDMLRLTLKSGYTAYFYGNDEGVGNPFTAIVGWATSAELTNVNYKYIYVVIKRTDEGDITSDDLSDVLTLTKGTEIIPFLTKDDAVVPFGTEIKNSNYSSLLSDCDNAIPNKIYNIYGCADSISHTPSISSTEKSATLFTFVDNKATNSVNWRVQFYVPTHPNTYGIYVRNAMNGSWNNWINLQSTEGAVFANITRITTSNYSSALPDFNSAVVNRIYNIFGCADLISHSPYGGSQSKSGTLIVFNGETTTSNWTVQFYATKDDNGSVLLMRFSINNIFTAWKNLTSANNVYAEEMGYFVATCINKAVITGISSATNILAFGDSIVKGVGVDKAWLGYVEDATECTVVNKSVGGALFGESVKTSYYWISTQIAGVSNTEWNNATLVIVGAGTNDAGNDTPLSELKEKVQSAITAIKAKTDAPILFITPIRRGASNTDADLLKLPMVSGIICNVAVSNGCSVLNGFDIPIPTYTIGQITDLTQDHLHPNDTGAKVYAMAVLNAVM